MYINKVQFLIHEAFVPTTISIQVSEHTNFAQMQYLGTVDLQPVQESQLTRELKTIWLQNVACKSVELLFGKNYATPLNKFNQVGVYRLQFEGSYVEDGEPIYQMHPDIQLEDENDYIKNRPYPVF